MVFAVYLLTDLQSPFEILLGLNELRPSPQIQPI